METNDEITDSIQIDYDSFFRYSRTKLNDMLNKARANERQHIIKIINDLWEKEGKNINVGVYAYPFEALRDMIIKELDKK